MPKSKPFLFSIILIILMAGCTLPIFNTENNESNTIESENAEEDEEIEDLQDSSETTAALPTETTTPPIVNLPKVEGEWTFYGNEPLRLERSEDIPKIILDQDGYLWFLGFGGIKKLDSALTDYVSYNPLGDDSEEILKELVVDSQNIIWAATDRQLFRLNGEEWESFEIPSSEEINDLAVGANDEIWVCSKDGVSRFSNDTWETFDTNRGLLENKCYVLSIDPDGNPWIVSQTNSLSHFVNHWEHYFVPDALVNSVEDDLIPTSFANIHIAPDEPYG